MNNSLNKNISVLKGTFNLAGVGALFCVFYAIISLYHMYNPTSLYFLTKIQPYMLFGGIGLWGICFLFAGVRLRALEHRHTGILLGGVIIVVWALTIFGEWYIDNHYFSLAAKFPNIVSYTLLALKFICPLMLFFVLKGSKETGTGFLNTVAFGVLLIVASMALDYIIYNLFVQVNISLTFNVWAFAVMYHKIFTLVLLSLSLVGFLICVLGLNSSHSYVYEVAEEAQDEENDEYDEEFDDEIGDEPTHYAHQETTAATMPVNESFGYNASQWGTFSGSYVDSSRFAPGHKLESEVELVDEDDTRIRLDDAEATLRVGAEVGSETTVKAVENEADLQQEKPEDIKHTDEEEDTQRS